MDDSRIPHRHANRHRGARPVPLRSGPSPPFYRRWEVQATGRLLAGAPLVLTHSPVKTAPHAPFVPGITPGFHIARSARVNPAVVSDHEKPLPRRLRSLIHYFNNRHVNTPFNRPEYLCPRP